MENNTNTTYRIVRGERTDLETFEVILRSTGRTVVGALSVSECRRHLADLIRLGHLPAGDLLEVAA